MVDQVRDQAARLVAGVTGEGRTISELTAELPARLSPAERARAQRLALETLRRADRADRMLGPHLRKLPAPEVMALLRLGVTEICALGAPAPAVVHALVGVAGAHRSTARAAGLVNAVLRKVADSAESWATLPPPRLPKWLRKRLIAAWGKPTVEAIEAVHAHRPPVDLTPRAPAEAPALARDLGGTLLPTGSVRLAPGAQISALAGYAEGRWWVQDAAAALPARLLAARPGERVADLCAAPGGKTLQLAASGAEVTAVDISEARLERLHENLARTGLKARVEVGDALAHAGGPYDAVLVDAPCSATGTIRRHPDLPFASEARDLAALTALQARLIDHALSLTRPGGRVVFCTCSLLPEEGEAQLEAALARHPALAVSDQASALAGVRPEWLTDAGALRLRPDLLAEEGGIDGFFIARLDKPA